MGLVRASWPYAEGDDAEDEEGDLLVLARWLAAALAPGVPMPEDADQQAIARGSGDRVTWTYARGAVRVDVIETQVDGRWPGDWSDRVVRFDGLPGCSLEVSAEREAAHATLVAQGPQERLAALGARVRELGGVVDAS
jgi:hypothetical protein